MKEETIIWGQLLGWFQGQGKFWLGKKFKDRFFIGEKYHCPVDNTKLPLGKVPLFQLASICASMIFHWLEIPLLCGQYKVAIGQSTFVPVGKCCSAHNMHRHKTNDQCLL